MSDLKPMPVVPESMEHGKYYIWKTKGGLLSVVALQSDGEAIVRQDSNQYRWFFEGVIEGCLYGPIAIPFPSTEEEQ